MSPHLRPGAAAALALAWATIAAPLAAAAAPDDPPDGLRDFCADRPGKATPACILDAGQWQAEVGAVDYVHDGFEGGSVDTWTLGEVNLRRGLTRSLEAHVDWAPVSIVRFHDAGQTAYATGVGDVEFALRQALTDPDGKGLAVSLVPYVTAPTGTRGMGAGGWQAGLRLPISAPLPAGFSFGATPEIDLVKDADGHGNHAAWSGVASVGHPVGDVALGVEFWAQRDEDPSSHVTQASFDFTAAWTPKALPATQLDLGVYLGLNHQTPDVEVAAGVTKRF